MLMFTLLRLQCGTRCHGHRTLCERAAASADTCGTALDVLKPRDAKFLGRSDKLHALRAVPIQQFANAKRVSHWCPDYEFPARGKFTVLGTSCAQEPWQFNLVVTVTTCFGAISGPAPGSAFAVGLCTYGTYMFWCQGLGRAVVHEASSNPPLPTHSILARPSHPLTTPLTHSVRKRKQK